MRRIRTASWVVALAGLTAASVLSQEARLSGVPVVVHGGALPKSPEWGTGGTTYYTMGAAEFLPKDSSTSYGTHVSPTERYANTSGADFQTTPHIPGGALLTYLEFDFCDVAPSDSLSLQLSNCDYLGICDYPPMAAIFTPYSTDSCGAYLWMDLTPLNYTVNNFSRRLLLEAYTGAGTISLTFYGATIGYKLQVSQPPGTPTFGDVPPADPGYQYIEALAASGITGGCGGGNFCPDNPVTRRQMAIFIAKALGLSWSGY
jgi:hypothetical protein